MDVRIIINGIEKQDRVFNDSLSFDDHINQQVDQARFRATERPQIGASVLIEFDGSRVFGGVIVRVEQIVRSRLKYEYMVTCKDWTQHLNRKLVIERFENKTVGEIIATLIDDYASDFTYGSVEGSKVVKSIAFDRIPVSECLERLATLTGYSWYADYFKDIHFFPRNTQPAPFSLDGSAGTHIWDSLRITEDITQLRNRVFVVGGEAPGNDRTELYVADGEQRQFPLAHKFAVIPEVEVNGTPITVGEDNRDEEVLFDAFWSFEEKYLRFKDSNYPDEGDQVSIEGTPLFPIVVNIASSFSIDEYGEYEFKIDDPLIVTREQAIDRARVELQSWSAAQDEGSFQTYRHGLRSGQVISVNVSGIAADFLIQSVSMQMHGAEAIYTVRLASMRTISAIDFMLSLMRGKEITQGEAEFLLSLLEFADSAVVSDQLGPIEVTSGPYLYDDAEDSEPGHNYARYDFATYD